jgi:hypothetical protein
MNRKPFIAAFVAIAAVATLASLPAQAQGEASYDHPTVFTSPVDRAEVKRQAAQAVSAGLVASGERSLVLEPTGSVLSRAQVVAETLEAIRIGAISRGERSVQPSAEQLELIRLAGQRAVAADAMRMAAR